MLPVSGLMPTSSVCSVRELSLTARYRYVSFLPSTGPAKVMPLSSWAAEAPMSSSAVPTSVIEM